jgi:hypothetical protein
MDRADLKVLRDYQAEIGVPVSENRLRSAIALAEYSPCFVFARRIRSIPSAVLGPVLNPPCILHLPFSIAGPLQRVCLRVLAIHRGAARKSPGGLLFLSHPRRFAWGVPSFSCVIPRSLQIRPRQSLARQSPPLPARLSARGSPKHAEAPCKNTKQCEARV